MSQQSSPSRVAGKSFRTFEHGGQKFLLSQPLRVSSYADEEALVLWKRRDPGEFAMRLVQRLPASYHAGIWEGAAAANMRGIPSEEEWASYGSSAWKTAFMFWNTLDESHKKSATGEVVGLIDGVQWALEFVSTLPPDKLTELRMKVAIVSQDAALKNSSGRPAPQPAETAEAVEPATESPATQATPPSTSSSGGSTDTGPTTPTDSLFTSPP